MLILEELYLGDVRPSERSFKRNTPYAKALDNLVKVGDELTDTLTEKQKEIMCLVIHIPPWPAASR